MAGGVAILLCMVYVFLFFPVLLFPAVRRIGYWDDSLLDYAHTRVFVSPYPETLVSLAQEPSSQPEGLAVVQVCSYDFAGAFWSRLNGVAWRHAKLYQDPKVISDICRYVSDGTLPPDHRCYDLLSIPHSSPHPIPRWYVKFMKIGLRIQESDEPAKSNEPRLHARQKYNPPVLHP
jgi:hypothetical protein